MEDSTVEERRGLLSGGGDEEDAQGEGGSRPGTPRTSSERGGGITLEAASEIGDGIDVRDKHVADAVENLYLVVVICAVALFAALCVEVINCFVPGSMPTWTLFLFLWVGHFVLLIVLFQSVKHMLHAMISKSTRERFSQKWHQANERRIPLIQYAVYHIGWIFGLSFALVITEIIAYLAVVGVIPAYAAFIIPYIIIGGALSNSLVCR
jgi:hypothetical protein